MARPRFKPSSAQRYMAKTLAALGIPHDHIAHRVGLRSPKTLRRHFRKELDDGAAEANAKVAQTLYHMATSGKFVCATIFWLRVRAGWNDQPFTMQSPAAAPPFIVSGEEH
jgi:hypothetical protein